MTTEDIIRTTTDTVFGLMQEFLSDRPQFVSEKTARHKYKGLLQLWEDAGLVKPVPTKKGRKTYPAHRLLTLYRAYVMGEPLPTQNT